MIILIGLILVIVVLGFHGAVLRVNKLERRVRGLTKQVKRKA